MRFLYTISVHKLLPLFSLYILCYLNGP
jgi:hypothetical protein